MNFSKLRELFLGLDCYWEHTSGSLQPRAQGRATMTEPREELDIWEGRLTLVWSLVNSVDVRGFNLRKLFPFCSLSITLRAWTSLCQRFVITSDKPYKENLYSYFSLSLNLAVTIFGASLITHNAHCSAWGWGKSGKLHSGLVIMQLWEAWKGP